MFPNARKQEADALAPPRWKAMIASGLAIYPLILSIPPLLEPFTERLPHLLGGLTTVAIITPLATFVMLPAVNWALKRWLYRGEPEP